MRKLIKKIFSVTNERSHKSIQILGFRIKIKYVKKYSHYYKLKHYCCIEDLDELLNKGLTCDHPVGIVIGYAKFGYNNRIYQNVTIGGKYGHKSVHPKDYPSFGNNITQFMLGRVLLVELQLVTMQSSVQIQL